MKNLLKKYNFFEKNYDDEKVFVGGKLKTHEKKVLYSIIEFARMLRAFFMKLMWVPFYSICVLLYGKDVIFCEGAVRRCLFWFRKSNWGDDLNKYMFEYATQKHVIFLPIDRYRMNIAQDYYSLIGSTLGWFNINNKVIYGTGIMDPVRGVRGVPKKVICVRGPKTRGVLVENGILCDEKYGDPALLLPVLYAPKLNDKKKRVVVIPNNGTKCPTKNIVVKDVVDYFNAELLLMTSYDDWKDIIDVIANAEFVISESLHGLIVAETYGIPSVWVELKEHQNFWDFKFLDFYESIGKKDEHIIKLYEGDSSINYGKIVAASRQWTKGNIDYSGLRELFPFEIVNTSGASYVHLTGRQKIKHESE